MNMNGMPNQTVGYYQNPYMPQRQNPYQTPSNGIIWVQGLEGAKAYQLPTNSNVMLLDSESDKFYIKTSDNIGMCNLRTFQFTEITDIAPTNSAQLDMSKYVTRDELQSILDSLNKGGKSDGKYALSTNVETKPVISE